MINKDKLFNEILCSKCFFCWDSNITHYITSRCIKIYGLKCFSPLSKFTWLNTTFRISRIIDIIIKYCSFWWIFCSSFPLSFPPIWKLFTIIKVFFFCKGSTTTPGNCENKCILHITKLIPQNNLKYWAKRCNHRNRSNRN